jgi:hypothetical protein
MAVGSFGCELTPEQDAAIVMTSRNVNLDTAVQLPVLIWMCISVHDFTENLRNRQQYCGSKLALEGFFAILVGKIRSNLAWRCTCAKAKRLFSRLYNE